MSFTYVIFFYMLDKKKLHLKRSKGQYEINEAPRLLHCDEKRQVFIEYFLIPKPTYGPEHFGVCHFTVFVVYLLLARLPGTAKTTASCQGTHWHVDKEFRQSD